MVFFFRRLRLHFYFVLGEGLVGQVGVVFAVNLVDLSRLDARPFELISVILRELQEVRNRGSGHSVHGQTGVQHIE